MREEDVLPGTLLVPQATYDRVYATLVAEIADREPSEYMRKLYAGGMRVLTLVPRCREGDLISPRAAMEVLGVVGGHAFQLALHDGSLPSREIEAQRWIRLRDVLDLKRALNLVLTAPYVRAACEWAAEERDRD